MNGASGALGDPDPRRHDRASGGPVRDNGLTRAPNRPQWSIAAALSNGPGSTENTALPTQNRGAMFVTDPTQKATNNPPANKWRGADVSSDRPVAPVPVQIDALASSATQKSTIAAAMGEASLAPKAAF